MVVLLILVSLFFVLVVLILRERFVSSCVSIWSSFMKSYLRSNCCCRVDSSGMIFPLLMGMLEIVVREFGVDVVGFSDIDRISEYLSLPAKPAMRASSKFAGNYVDAAVQLDLWSCYWPSFLCVFYV